MDSTKIRRNYLICGLLICFAVSGVFAIEGSAKPIWPCLPANLTENQVIRVDSRMVGSRMVKKNILLRDILRGHKAKCRNGVLIDRTGKRIKFFALRGCWGTPPDNYQEIIEKQEKELERLKRGSTVIEIPCNPDETLPPAGRNPGG